MVVVVVAAAAGVVVVVVAAAAAGVVVVVVGVVHLATDLIPVLLQVHWTLALAARETAEES